MKYFALQYLAKMWLNFEKSCAKKPLNVPADLSMKHSICHSTFGIFNHANC